MTSCPTTYSNIIQSERNPLVQTWEKSRCVVVRKICKRLYSASNSCAEQTCAQELLLKEKKMPSPREQVNPQSIKSEKLCNVETFQLSQMLFGGTALIAAAVGGYFYSKRWAHQKRDWERSNFDSGVQEGRHPCAWAHWGWIAQWLEGGWGHQGRREVKQLEVGEHWSWQLQGLRVILIW